MLSVPRRAAGVSTVWESLGAIVRCVTVRLAGVILVAAAGCGRSEPSPASRHPTPTESATPDALLDAQGKDCRGHHPVLGPGLVAEQWTIDATPAGRSPPCIDVVRADPTRYRLRVLSGAGRDARGWRDEHDLVAVTNAGMFHADGAPVGLIVADGAARGRDNQKMSGFIAWDPRSSDPEVIVAGKPCDGFDLAGLRQRYRSMVQSYRLLDCDGTAIRWQDPKQYSAAAIGVDRAGRIVFLHARAAVTMTELAAAVAAHDLTGALFLEGGPEASLVVRGANASLERVGSYETGFLEDDSNTEFWKLPNVIGLAAR